MEILINGEPIDYSLDKEETVGQVLKQLAQWAQNQGAVIADVYVNEQLLKSEIWPPTPLSEVWAVEIRLLNNEDCIIERLTVLETYCREFSDSIEGDSGSPCLNDWPRMAGEIAALVPSFSLQPLEKFLADWCNTGHKEQLKNELFFLREQIQHFSLLLVDEPSYRNMLIQQLIMLRKDLHDLGAVFHQEGKNVLVQVIHKLLAWLSDFERLAQRSQECLRHYQQVHPVLEQIEHAMAVTDWPLVSDLLEYELQPKLVALQTDTLSAEKHHEEQQGENANLA